MGPLTAQVVVPRLVLLGIMAVITGCDQRAAPPPASRGLRVAAAANMKFALDELIPLFERDHSETRLIVTYGSSGQFFTQIVHHAPFDVFLSADRGYPQELADRGLADPRSAFVYATGQLVIWARNNSAIDPTAAGLEALVHPAARRVAIANSQHAPYGRAAEEALLHLGYFDRVRDRVVLGESIAQTAQFLESGAADVGIIALAQALAPSMASKGRYAPVPLEAYTALEQSAVILTRTTNRPAADAFCAYLRSPIARELLLRHGYHVAAP